MTGHCIVTNNNAMYYADWSICVTLKRSECPAGLAGAEESPHTSESDLPNLGQ